MDEGPFLLLDGGYRDVGETEWRAWAEVAGLWFAQAFWFLAEAIDGLGYRLLAKRESRGWDEGREKAVPKEVVKRKDRKWRLIYLQTRWNWRLLM